jgi:hypothetical protein
VGMAPTVAAKLWKLPAVAALGSFLAARRVFPEVSGQLEGARRRGGHLVILSHSDRDPIDASIAAMGVSVSAAIVAFEVGYYAPALGRWQPTPTRELPDVHGLAGVLDEPAS